MEEKITKIYWKMASRMPGLHVTTFWYENHAQDASETPPDAPKATEDGPRNLEEAHKPPPRRFQDGARHSQDATKTLPGRLQNGSKPAPRRFCLPRRPKTLQDAPGGLQDAILVDFRNQNGGMLALKINEKTISTSKSNFSGFE